MRQVYDNIRKQWVAASPEEVIRQKWLLKMVKELQFPRELLVIERELKMLPHLQRFPHPLPSRRIDILAYDRNTLPLLLIECKQGPLFDEALQQVLAYSTYVQPACVAIVNENQVISYHLTSKQWDTKRLPSFPELVEAAHG